jgi:hypothetical protein
METVSRIGALDIAEAIAARIGSYVDMDFIQFLAVDGNRVLCWYMNCDGDGPTFEITLTRAATGWTLDLIEHAPGIEQQVELP